MARPEEIHPRRVRVRRGEAQVQGARQGGHGPQAHVEICEVVEYDEPAGSRNV